MSIRILNLNGKIVLQPKPVPFTSGTQTIPIDMAGLPCGLYFVEIHDGKVSEAIPFILK